MEFEDENFDDIESLDSPDFLNDDTDDEHTAYQDDDEEEDDDDDDLF